MKKSKVKEWFWIVKEDGKSKTYIPLQRKDLEDICMALFESRVLIESHSLRMAIGNMLHPDQDKEIQEMIKRYSHEKIKKISSDN